LGQLVRTRALLIPAAQCRPHSSSRQDGRHGMSKEHYIPDRPSISIKVEEHGYVVIDVAQISKDQTVEYITLDMPADSAKEMAEAILQLLRNE
jgi:hypothetical protein